MSNEEALCSLCLYNEEPIGEEPCCKCHDGNLFFQQKKELVSHPLHYGGDTVYECIKVLKAWLSPDEYKGFLHGNVIKYLCRTGKKDDSIQELKKALFYLQKEIEFLESD